MAKMSLIVTIDVPEDYTRTDVTNYVRDAVRGFSLSRKATVKPVGEPNLMAGTDAWLMTGRSSDGRDYVCHVFDTDGRDFAAAFGHTAEAARKGAAAIAAKVRA